MTFDVQEIIEKVLSREQYKEVLNPKPPEKKIYTLYSNNPKFEILKVWNTVSGGIPTVEIVPNLIYTVDLYEKEHKKFYNVISSIGYSIGEKIDSTRTTLDRYIRRYDMHLNSSPMHESIEDYMKFRKSSTEYRKCIRSSLNSVLTMTSEQLIKEVVEHLTPLVSCSESDLTKFISALYDELLYFADRWYLTDSKVTCSYFRKRHIEKINEHANDLYYEIDRQIDLIENNQFRGYSDSKYRKLGGRALKVSGIKEFECPQYNEWRELYFDDVDNEIERKALTPYKGQSFYGIGNKPFEFFYFQRINDQFDSAFHAIQQTVKEHMITYIGGRNIHRFCDYMDSINVRLENGENVSIDEIVEFMKPNP